MNFKTKLLLCYILPKVIRVIASSLQDEAKETKTPYDDLAIQLAFVLADALPQLCGEEYRNEPH